MIYDRKTLFYHGLICLWLCVLPNWPLGAQSFNHQYPNGFDITVIEPKGTALLNPGCNWVAINSILNSNGMLDAHILFMEPDGAPLSEYHFGDPNGNDEAHSVCQSLDNPSEYFIAGKSAAAHMLILKVNDAGALLWAREIEFAQPSEAIQILPITNPRDPGYIVVGNAGDEVAAARITESGTLLWARDFPGSGNYSYHHMTDATIMEQNGHKLCAVVGNRLETGSLAQSVFAFSFEVRNGHVPFIGWHFTAANAINDPQIVERRSSPALLDAIVSYNNSSTGGRIDQVTAMNLNLYNGTVGWHNTYEIPGITSQTLEDMALVGTNEFSMLLTEHFQVGEYNPVYLRINGGGDVIRSHSFNVGEHDQANSIVEDCTTGNEVYASYKWVSNRQVNMRIVRYETTLPDCGVATTWNQTPVTRLPGIIEFLPDAPGSMLVYAPANLSYGNGKAFDCAGQLVSFRRATVVPGTENESESAAMHTAAWVYPNPSSDYVQVALPHGAVTRISFYNAVGQLVWQQNGVGPTQVDVSAFPAGLYRIELQGEDATVLAEKLIVE